MAVAPPQSAGDQAQPTLACDPTQISEPLYLRNLSDTDPFANPGTLAESGSNLETVGNLPAAVAGSSVLKKYRLGALSGVAAYLAVSFVVGFLICTTVLTGTVTHPIPASSIGTANREAQSREAVLVTSPSLLTSQPGVADSQADAAPSPGAQPSQSRSDQAEAAPDEQLSQSPNAQGDSNVRFGGKADIERTRVNVR
jgi:hypothetical protein